MTVSVCPSPEQLRALIDGKLSSDDTQSATDHIGDCTQCQTAIQTIASSGAESPSVSSSEIPPIEHLVNVPDGDRPESDSAYWRAIRALGEEEKDTRLANTKDTPVGEVDTNPAGIVTVETQAANQKDLTLSFLKPSDDPAYVGKLEHFEISRVIGRGGMGIVLEAFDTRLRRTVAIKVLNPEYAKNDVARQRFCREGRAAAAITHENIVAMHQVAREFEGDVAFLVMQYIEGDTLETKLQDGPLEPKVAAKVAMQISSGLAAAHSRDMVHRDIKPANILIESSTGQVKLTDFGLARATDDVRLTKTGMVTGTPLYMSPEQATGASADERSDLFSLGAVLYEMLTGISPFEAPSIVGVMKRIMDETPRPPARLQPSIEPALSELTMALLEKNPDRRPESAEFVAGALSAILSDFTPACRKSVPSINLPNKKRRSGSHRLVSRNLLRLAWAIGMVGILSLISSATWMAINGTERGAAADSSAPEAPSFPSVVLPGNSGTVWAVDFDPMGNQVVTAVEDGSLCLWDIESQSMVKSFSAHRGTVWMVQYHPSRRLVASSGDDGMVKLWDTVTWELRREWDAESSVRKIAFSPDGEKIVAGDRDGVIHIWEIGSGLEVATETQPGSIRGVDWSADSKQIATVGSDKVLRIWDADSLEPRQTMPGHDGPIYNVAFAPTGTRVASVGWGKDIFIWNTETGQEEQRLRGSKSDNWSVAFCADGDHAVVASQDGNCRIWELSSGRMIAVLAGHDSAVHNVSLDSTNYRIATSGRDGTVRIWDLSELKDQR